MRNEKKLFDFFFFKVVLSDFCEHSSVVWLLKASAWRALRVRRSDEEVKAASVHLSTSTIQIQSLINRNRVVITECSCVYVCFYYTQ